MSLNEDPNRRYALPEFPLQGLKILDIGCNTGWVFQYSRFAGAASLHGVDVDRRAVLEGRRYSPWLDLQVASAEHLPHPDATFDVVMSRVSLPYTYIPRALSEALRVLKPGGRLFVSMHDWRHQASFFRGASLKRALDLTYVAAASLLLSTTGCLVNKPWNGRYETVQTPRCTLKMIRRAGFVDGSHERWEHHAIYQARRP